MTIQNLAPARSVSFAPLRLGFHSGADDAFNYGQTASPAILSIAEGGSGSAWFPAFAAADPTATLGSVGRALLPGTTANNTFRVVPLFNPFFSFASMVLPSNDLFLGNDSPVAFRLFDRAGGRALGSISQRGRDIWDAGSEVADPANAAFVVGGNNSLRTGAGEISRISFQGTPVPAPPAVLLAVVAAGCVAVRSRRRASSAVAPVPAARPPAAGC